MANIDTTVLYELTNSFTGARDALASSTTNDSLLIAPSATSPTQQWHFTSTDIDGFWRLHTAQSGDSLSLDVLNTDGVNSILLHFFDTGEYSGQYWRLDQWGDGTYRFSNNFTGPDLHLDLYSDTLQPHLATGDTSGQHWSLSEVAGAASSGAAGAASTSSSIATSTSVASPLESSTSPSPLPAAATSAAPASSSSSGGGGGGGGGGGLGTGAIAGIAVGGVFGLALLIGAIWFFAFRRKRTSSPESRPVSTAWTPQQPSPAPMSDGKDGFMVQARMSELEGGQFQPDQKAELDGGRVQSPVELPIRQY